MFSEQTNIHYAHTIKPAQQGHLEDKKKKSIMWSLPSVCLQVYLKENPQVKSLIITGMQIFGWYAPHLLRWVRCPFWLVGFNLDLLGINSDWLGVHFFYFWMYILIGETSNLIGQTFMPNWLLNILLIIAEYKS